MQGQRTYLRLRGSMPEPGQPQVERLLCSRDLLFHSPDEHRDCPYCEDELHATKKNNVTWYSQLRAAYRALNLDHVYTTSFMSPLYPLPQHHSLNASRCLCGSCPSSQQVSQLLDSKFPLLYVGKLLHFGAHAWFCQHIPQNVS